MTSWLIFRDGEPAGYTEDQALAEYLDGREICTDGMHATSMYATVQPSKLKELKP